MMSEEGQCCSAPPFNTTLREKIPLAGLVKPKEILILVVMFSLFTLSFYRFFKHWKKNYYDNANHLPTYYKEDSLAATPVRDFHCHPGSISGSDRNPLSRRSTLRSPNDTSPYRLSSSREGTPRYSRRARILRTQSVCGTIPKRPPPLSRNPNNKMRRQYSDRPVRKHRYFLSEDYEPASISIEIDSFDSPTMCGSRKSSVYQLLSEKIEEEPEDKDMEGKMRNGKEGESEMLANGIVQVHNFETSTCLGVTEDTSPTRRLDILRNRLRLNVQETVLSSRCGSSEPLNQLLDGPSSLDSTGGWNIFQTQATVEPVRSSLDRTDSLVVMVNYPSEKMCASRRTSL